MGNPNTRKRRRSRAVSKHSELEPKHAGRRLPVLLCVHAIFQVQQVCLSSQQLRVLELVGGHEGVRDFALLVLHFRCM